MTLALPISLAVVTAPSVLAALLLFAVGRLSAALLLAGLPLALTSAVVALVMAKNTAGGIPNNSSALGLSLLAVLAALAILCFLSIFQPRFQIALFWLTQTVNLAVLGSLMYLIFFFHIF